MRSREEIIHDVRMQNQAVFSYRDQVQARGALRTYMAEIHHAGLRWEFDCRPRDINKLQGKIARHRKAIAQLEARAKNLHALIKLLKEFEGRTAVVLNPMWRSREGAPEMLVRTLNPDAAVVYSAFHAAVVAYLDELGKQNSDGATIADRARLAAYVVNAPAWREAGVSVFGEGVCGYGSTRLFLGAVLTEPEQSGLFGR
ncbi:MAG TPA: hypothetical protein VFZ48_05445 [Candidatus Saccharimonadales bacterium]